MTKEVAINSALLSLIGLFAGGAATLFLTNFWYSIVCVLVVVGLAYVYEKLPASQPNPQ